MTQRESQRQWYVKNRDRILNKQATRIKDKQNKNKRVVVCPACGNTFITSDLRVKYCKDIKCKKVANFKRGSKFRILNKEYLQRYYKEYDVINKDLRKLTGRKGHLRRKYWITLDDYNRMFSEQKGRCAICGIQEEKLHVDHSHKTNKVRSLLCFHCNAGLGHFEENIELLNNAIEYIKCHS